MEYESGAGGLTYRYTYGAQKNKNNVVIYGIPNGTGSIEESHEYPDGTETIAKLYYHQDRLGSADYLTNNQDGKVESYAGRDDWGEPTMKPVLKIGARQLDLASEYAGYGMDEVLGLYYARARMYDAANRRFASADPVKGSVAEPASMAQYTYCLDNPVRYADPLGLAVTDWDRAHLSESEIAALEANTAAWIAADAEGDQAAKDAAHAASEAIRNKYRTGTETESENKDGNTVGIPDVEKPPKASDVVDTTSMGEENRSILDDYVSVVNSYSDGDLLDLAAGGYMGDYLIAVARAAIASLKAGEKARAAAQVRQEMIREFAKTLVNGTDPIVPHTSNPSGNNQVKNVTIATNSTIGADNDGNNKIVIINGYGISNVSEKNGKLYGSMIDMIIAVGGTHYTNPYKTAASFSAEVVLGSGKYIEFHFTQNGMFIYYGNDTLVSNSRDYISFARSDTDWRGMNGITYDYAVDIDDFCRLMNSYGVTSDMRTFDALYDTTDAAALAWYDQYLDGSIAEDREWGAWIYSVDVKQPFTDKITTKYFHGDLIIGERGNVPLEGWESTRNYDYALAGWMHTHGSYGVPGTDYDWTYWNFSWGDMAFSVGTIPKYYGTDIIPGYVGNVKGEIFSMDPSIDALYEKYPNEPRWTIWHGTSINSPGIIQSEALDNKYVIQIR